MRILVFTCFLIGLLIRQSGAQLERLEAVQCKPSEFYYAPRDACKSCSDLRLLFFGGHQEEWSNSDAINLSKPAISEDASRQQKPGSKVEPSRFSSAGREILSRLIGLDELQAGGQRYSMAPESASESTTTDDEEELSTRASSESANPLTLDTMAAEKFVDGFIGSQLVRDELLGSIEQCKYFHNSSACQMWSNLCVMSLYSQSSNLAHATRARLNNQLRGTSGDRSIRGGDEESLAYAGSGAGGRQWWQQCGQEFNKYTICDSLRSWWRYGANSIDRDMSNIFPSSDEDGLSIKIAGSNPSLRLNQPIQLLAYKYSLQGKLIAVDQFGLGQMAKFCLTSKGISERYSQLDDNFIRVGRDMQTSCKFNTLQAQLLTDASNDTVFVDLYMAHQLNGAVFVKPVPVLIRNLLYNRMLINQLRLADTSRLKLVHRFFQSSVVQLDGGEQVLVYAKNAHLNLKFKTHERSAQLLSIVLVLDYGQLLLNQKQNYKNYSTNLRSNQLLELKTEIQVTQTLVDMMRHKMDFELTLIILSVLSCIWSLLRSYNILRYHGLVKMDLYSLIRFLFVSCDTLGDLIATCTLLFVGFLFIAFKFQQNIIYVLVPDKQLDETILINIKLALLFKLIGLSCKMFDLLNVDVFFIDWERPKMLTSAEIQNHLSYYSKQEANSNEAFSHKNSLGPRLSGDHHKELSFWRPYTVVEKWLELQTMRRIDLALQLILLVCLNEAIQFTELARAEPEWNIWSRVGGSRVLDNNELELQATVSSSYRLLIHATIYLLSALAQIVWHKYFYETMIRDRVHEFIDLCSIGNVSLFCMLYPRFGYYIHGRNANGSGDSSISEMNGLLEREARGLCSRRGLVPNTDEQVFVLILPRLINDHYRKLLYQYKHHQQQHHISSLFNNNGNNEANDNFEADNLDSNFFRSALNTSKLGSQMPSFGSNQAPIETIVNRRRVINAFLSNFLEHHYKDIDYSIKEWRRFESFFSEPELEAEMISRRNGVLTPRGLPSVIIRTPEAPIASTKLTPAIFYKDPSNSFTSVLWLGLEWDLFLTELLCFIILDQCLGQSLFISCIILYSLHWLLKRFYQMMARKNLVYKALIDDKFLLRS